MLIGDKLKELLLAIPSARMTGQNDVTIRCMYCGDSVNPKSAHLGINLGYNDTPLYFHCFKCHASGLLTPKILLSWGVLDSELFIDINKYNKGVLRLEKNSKFNDRVVYRLNNDYIYESRLSELKLKYINKRIGTNLNYNDLLNEKIVLNLKDLLDTNKITKVTREPYLIDQLDESFIGFISQDQAFVNLRNLRQGKVSKVIDKRYVNYNIFNKFNNTERYYTIPTSIDLLNPNRIRLNISEGPFDILSVYHNLLNKQGHSIYSAILGSGYLNIIRHFICKMKFINLEIHIYIDNDIPMHIVNELRNMLIPFQMPLYIHRNIYPGEKDFGVPIERINEQIQRIL